VFFLQHVLERFQTEYPGVEILMMTETAEHLIQKIRNGTVDLGIIFIPTGLRKEERGVEYEPLYKEEFVFVVGSQHPLAKRKIVPLSQLLEYPFIMYMKTSYVRKLLEYRLAKAQLVPKISMELENEEAIEKMLQGGNRVALLSKRRATSDHIHGLRTKEEPIYCQVAMVFPQAVYVPAVVKEFAGMCREAAASGVPSPG
jgi:DNA-binding transcriptional LysR family regulator